MSEVWSLARARRTEHEWRREGESNSQATDGLQFSRLLDLPMSNPSKDGATDGI